MKEPQKSSKNLTHATLAYDGTCGYCCMVVSGWKDLIGDKIKYDTRLTAYHKHIVLILQDGKVLHGAEALLTTLSYNSALSSPLWMYRKVPGFKSVSEGIYKLASKIKHSRLSPIARVLCGKSPKQSSYTKAHVIFMRLLGLINLIIFTSILVQFRGLIGQDGILPLQSFFDFVNSQLGLDKFYLVPTLFWISSTNTAIIALAALGAILSIVVMIGFLHPLILLALYLLHLSFVVGGQAFMTFQWDALALEVGFLAIFFASYSRRIHFLFTFLLFRLVFSSGLAKLLSGDEAWRNLSALKHHFATQPLPTPLAYYMGQFPTVVLQSMTFATLATELALPFFFFMPRRARIFAAYVTITSQTMIAATGNYGFFNLLAIALSLLLLDNQHLGRFSKIAITAKTWMPKKPTGLAASIHTSAFVLLLFFAVLRLLTQFVIPPPESTTKMSLGDYTKDFIHTATNITAPYKIVNAYGLFANITTTRAQIIFEGSADNKKWTEYKYRYQPDDPSEAPSMGLVYLPRMDWQMWFIALQARQLVTIKDYQPRPQYVNPLLVQMARRLLENEKTVTSLFDNVPDKKPRYVRAKVYDYQFAGPKEKAAGMWWIRKDLGVYLPPVTLGDETAATDSANTQDAPEKSTTQQ